MTNEQINIAIAEACGWKKRTNESWEFDWMNPMTDWSEPEPPDYRNDLNAMQDAEAVLNDEQKDRYFLNIMRLCGNLPKAIQATASERAESFLKAIGKWEE